MSKLTKLFKHPVKFFKDAAKNKKLKESKRKIFVVGFSTWKSYLRMFFPKYDLIFLPKDIAKGQFNIQYKKKILLSKDTCQVFIWGFKAPSYILEFLRDEKISTKFVEDGFVRSVKLGATKTPPMSLCLDSKTPYFDATKASDLEDLLNNYDFTGQDLLIKQANAGIKLLLETGVSKYNNSKAVEIDKVYGPKIKSRILVLGQVEDDASIKYGCLKKLTNNDVVRLAVKENPFGQVIYKPHPDVMNGHRPYQSNPEDVENIAQILSTDIPLTNAFETVDHVYTITSLGGFEALLRGIKVTTLGAPFYSGWGLTDDRQICKRRTRILTVAELFAVAYLKYPKYYDVKSGKAESFFSTVNTIKNLIQSKSTSSKNSNSTNGNVKKIKVSTDKNQSKNLYFFGFGAHKLKYYARLHDEYNAYSIDLPVAKQTLLADQAVLKTFNPSEDDLLLIWGYKGAESLEVMFKAIGVKVLRVEDAFIRSIGLGGIHSSPLSYIEDSRGLYFNAKKESDLEHILNTYSFDEDKLLLARSEKIINQMVSQGVSKYNYAEKTDISKFYGVKSRKRVLVIGQVEDDASIQYGCDKQINNNDLVVLAKQENPDAQIIYKPHPDVLNGLRKRASDPSLVEGIATVIYDSISINDALETVDHVYTITSLAGFEALIRNIKVTTIGAPFYSGWGLTDDRQNTLRRNKKLSVVEVFAGAYILYSKYINPFNFERIQVEEALELLTWMKINDIHPVEFQGGVSPQISVNRVNKLLVDGNFKQAQILSNLLVSMHGDAESYYQRAKLKIASGNIDNSVFIDFDYCCNLSKWMVKKYIISYAKFLLEFEGYDKRLNSVLSKLVLLKDKLTQKELIFVCTAYAEGGFFIKIIDLLGKDYIDILMNDIHQINLCSFLFENIEPSEVQTHKSELVSKIKKNVNETVISFENYIKGNIDKVCIVGNSPVELGKKRGHLIDGFEYIIRFNDYSVFHPYSVDYGTKTNVWTRMPKNMGVEEKRGSFDLVIVTGSNPLTRIEDGLEVFNTMSEKYGQVAVVPFDIYKALFRLLGSAPSSGMQVIYWIYCLTGEISKEQIFGFELIDQLPGKDAQYKPQDSRVVRHNWFNERKLFNELVKKSESVV